MWRKMFSILIKWICSLASFIILRSGEEYRNSECGRERSGYLSVLKPPVGYYLCGCIPISRLLTMSTV